MFKIKFVYLEILKKFFQTYFIISAFVFKKFGKSKRARNWFRNTHKIRIHTRDRHRAAAFGSTGNWESTPVSVRPVTQKRSRKCFTSPFKVSSSRRGRRQWDRDVVPESRTTVVTLWERWWYQERKPEYISDKTRSTVYRTTAKHPVCVQRKSYANPRENMISGN